MTITYSKPRTDYYCKVEVFVDGQGWGQLERHAHKVGWIAKKWGSYYGRADESPVTLWPETPIRNLPIAKNWLEGMIKGEN